MEGIIEDFQGSWGSGLATLVIRHDDETVCHVPCDNGPTVRLLARMFPGIITSGHCVDVRALRGRRIQYGFDDMGLVLGWIALPEGEYEEEEEEEA